MAKKSGLVLVALAYGAIAFALVEGIEHYYRDPAIALKRFLLFSVFFLVLAFLETIVHEIGHVACGWLCGAPLSGVKIGSGPSIKLGRTGKIAVVLGVMPGDGRVDFHYLPLSRKRRVFMYAGGIISTSIVAMCAWLLVSPAHNWFRVEMLILFALCNVVNFVGKAPAGGWSDGQAIRGLLRYK